MTDKQENLYSMFVVLHGFLLKFPAIISSIPAFQRAVEKFGLLITQIREVDSGRPTIKAGKSEIKLNKKSDLASAVFQLASSLYTYADEHKQFEILNRVDKAESYYKRMRDTALIAEAKDLVKLTLGKESDLLDHGLTAQEIAEVTTLAGEFETAMQEMGTSEAEGSSATKSVYQLIGEAKDIVDNQINIHAAKFKKKDPDFYNQFLSASRIVDSGVRYEKKTEPAPAGS